jgi:hypothetical protein
MALYTINKFPDQILNVFYCQIYAIGWNTSLTTYMKFSSVSYTHRSDREHDDNECIYRIKGFIFRYCLFSGPLSGEPDRVSQKIVLIKTVSITNSPLFCLSVIYIQKSLKRWKKDFFAVTEKISDLNSFYFHAKTILFWDYFFQHILVCEASFIQTARATFSVEL